MLTRIRTVDRDGHAEAVRAILHGAMALYLARYLNVPPARIPGDGDDRLNDLPTDAEALRAALLDAFDRQRQVDLVARLVARHLTLGHPPRTLLATLARGLLREDAGFHAYQMLEAGVRQFGEWGSAAPCWPTSPIPPPPMNAIRPSGVPSKSSGRRSNMTGGDCAVTGGMPV